MKRLTVATMACGLVLGGSLAASAETAQAVLLGGDEVPALSTPAAGELRAFIRADGSAIDYELSYDGIATAVLQAHIHVGQAGVNGGVSAFLCGGAGKPACPGSGPVSGTIAASDVLGPAGQGVAAGELEELIAAIRGGIAYANVHSVTFPGGEIRGQLQASSR